MKELPNDKVDVWSPGPNQYQARLVVQDRLYGPVRLYSDVYDSVKEADCRVFVLARLLGVDRDTLPVRETYTKEKGE